MSEWFGPVPPVFIVLLVIFGVLVTAIACAPTRLVEFVEKKIRKRRAH
jgi:hypothetical protein